MLNIELKLNFCLCHSFFRAFFCVAQEICMVTAPRYTWCTSCRCAWLPAERPRASSTDFAIADVVEQGEDGLLLFGHDDDTSASSSSYDADGVAGAAATISQLSQLSQLSHVFFTSFFFEVFAGDHLFQLPPPYGHTL